MDSVLKRDDYEWLMEEWKIEEAERMTQMTIPNMPVEVALPVLTNSAIKTFKTCRKKYWFAYEHRLRPLSERSYLTFGSAMHHAIELLGTQGIESAREYLGELKDQWSDRFAWYTLWALFHGYANRYADHPLIIEVIEAELVFNLPIVNPETGSASKTFNQSGKMDSISKLSDGRTVLHELKTTDEDICSERYWKLILMDSQTAMYTNAARDMGYDIVEVIYDVIRKPSMSPLKATPIEKRQYKKADGKLYANQRETDETPEEWGERLYADICERPDFYFARREIPRLEQDLDGFRFDLWDTAKDLRSAQLTGRWYRNVGRFTCGFCVYFDLCAGLIAWNQETVPEGFMRLDTPHPELERQ